MKIKSEIIFTLHGIIVAIVILLLPWEAHAADDGARSAETLTLYLENDSFGFDNNDRYYTHGTKLSWVSSDLNDYGEHSKVAEWIFSILDVIPPIQEQECQRSFALSLGQNIYTPEDKTRSGLIEDDRPYAGITYLGFGFNRSNERHMDTLELNLGIVGRHSYAEDCQKIFHERIDVKNPKGWGNQLHDEPIVNICFEHKYKLFDLKHASGMGIDIIPHAGFDVGNAFTRANAGGAIRVGWNLPKDFGTFLIRSGSESNVPQNDEQPNFNTLPHRLGMHVFFAVHGMAVARNIFLDGNTFQGSHSVEKKPFVAHYLGGVGIIFHSFKITYSYVHSTKEFEGQKEDQKYSAVSISFSF